MEALPSPHPTMYMDEPDTSNRLPSRPLFQDSYQLGLLETPRPKKQCLTLPMAVHHLLRRQYVPSRTFLDKYPNVKEMELWIGVDMDRFYITPRTRDDFIACVTEAFDYSKFYMSENPEDAACIDRGFWMQIRGYFPGPGFEAMMAAAKRHLLLLDRLIKGGYVTL